MNKELALSTEDIIALSSVIDRALQTIRDLQTEYPDLIPDDPNSPLAEMVMIVTNELVEAYEILDRA